MYQNMYKVLLKDKCVVESNITPPYTILNKSGVVHHTSILYMTKKYSSKSGRIRYNLTKQTTERYKKKFS